jgi:hypothetical protein
MCVRDFLSRSLAVIGGGGESEGNARQAIKVIIFESFAR